MEALWTRLLPASRLDANHPNNGVLIPRRNTTFCQPSRQQNAKTISVTQDMDQSNEIRVYVRLAPRLALQVGRYAHVRQFKRMRKALKRQKD